IFYLSLRVPPLVPDTGPPGVLAARPRDANPAVQHHRGDRGLKLSSVIFTIKDSFPARFGGIHFVNQPWYIHALYTVIRPFLKDKTRKRIFMHGNNLNSLHQLMHPEILPSELGGMMPPYDMGTWARTLLDHAYDEETEYCPESYSLSVKDLEKDLSPKTMKRIQGCSGARTFASHTFVLESQSVVEPGVLKRPEKVKSEEENMQPLLSLD
ncbi:unnamed protein product, partial [Coregonus sp. 'balchen']